uniref:CSON002589 protein n=1 Tax=Culicoides sonorensis TaxID=179676 RepID=A0A336LS26_CULSO
MDLASLIKPFMTLSPTEQDVDKLIDFLIENENELSKINGFYIDSFVAVVAVEIYKRCSDVSTVHLKNAVRASNVLLKLVLQNIDQHLNLLSIETLLFMCEGKNYTGLLANPTVVNFMQHDTKKLKDFNLIFTNDEKKMEKNIADLNILDYLSKPIVEILGENGEQITNGQKILIMSNIGYLKQNKAGQHILVQLVSHNICTLIAETLLRGLSHIFIMNGLLDLNQLCDEEYVLKAIVPKFQHFLVNAQLKHVQTLLQHLLFIYKQTEMENITKINAAPNTISDFNIFENYLFGQRLWFLSNNKYIHHVLSILAVVAYKKSCSVQFKSDDIDPTCSESTTYFNDTYSCSDTESDESGSLLGSLFKETVTDVEGLQKHHLLLTDNKKKLNSKFLIKDESLDFINLSIDIYNFLRDVTTMSINIDAIDQMQMSLLVYVLKEIDQDLTKTKVSNENEIIENHDLFVLNNKLIQATSEYIHNLLCNSLLTENIQHNLLLSLNISPWKPESSNWPLNISPKFLKILVQVISLKNQQEKEAASLSIWHRMIETIIDKLYLDHYGEDFKDINIEHAQILLYLFYSLNLMQKKSILLLTAGGVIRGASIIKLNSYETPPSNEKLLLVARLLLFFEYIMKYLYTPPVHLLEQIESILIDTNFSEKYNDIKDSFDKNHKDNVEYQDVQNLFKKDKKFYNLAKLEPLGTDFKLDGLAWNFILCTPEKLKYQLLLDALVDVYKISNLFKESTDPSALTTVQYMINVCLKLLIGLPPSTYHVEQIIDGSTFNIYVLFWTMRCFSGTPQTRYLVVNSLVKQGLYTQVAEEMWNKLTGRLNNQNFFLDAFNNSLSLCLNKFDKDSLSLLKLLTVDSISIYFYVHQHKTTKDLITAQTTSSDIFFNLLTLLNGVTDILFKMYIDEFDFELPTPIAVMLLSISSTLTISNARMVYFIEKISTFIRRKECKSGGEVKNSKAAYDLALSQGLPAENFVIHILDFHLHNIACVKRFSKSLEYTIKNLIKIISVILSENYQINIDKCYKLITMLMDIRAVDLVPDLFNICKAIFEGYANKNLENLLERHVLKQSYLIYKDVCSEKFELESSMKNKILITILEFWNSIATEKVGKLLFHDLFFSTNESSQFCEILFSFTKTKVDQSVICNILQLFTDLMDNKSEDFSINESVGAKIIQQFKDLDTILKIWASFLIFGRNIWYWEDEKLKPFSTIIEPRQFRKIVTIIKSFYNALIVSAHLSPLVNRNIFSAFCLLGDQLFMPNKVTLPILDYLDLLCLLYNANQQNVQKMLLDKLVFWLQLSIYTNFDLNENCLALDDQRLDNIYVLLNSLTLITGCTSQCNNTNDSNEEEISYDCPDEVSYEEEESGLDESDDENVSTKTCTYLITQKDFMNQHWYYCYTCNMFDGIGVCSICAKVCHKNHDVAYAKYGNFFCDCGAKEDGTCIALSKKWNTSVASYKSCVLDNSKRSKDLKKTDHLSWKPSDERILLNENFKQNISLSEMQVQRLIETITCFLKEIEPNITESCIRSSSLNCYFRAKSEQGSIIRQLISTNSVRRVGLCCLSVPFGAKQHLIVAQDKGKINVLQLSNLLKQADSGKHKLMITKLNSANVPVSIIVSMASNILCDDLLAICGIKECHVLQFSFVGAVKKHIIVSLQLEAGNYIKRAIWLPSSLSKLAIITAETIQIYEVSKHASVPEYCFLLPSGKVRDCTFNFCNGSYTMYIISSSGHIYVQTLSEECLAKHGNYYITQILDFKHPSLKDTNGQVLGGGVSVYFSHTLQFLFCSFGSGNNFAFSLQDEFTIKNIFNIPAVGPSKIFSKNLTQPLFNWSEVPYHPGIVFAMFQNSFNVAALMVTPSKFCLQELKMQTSKVKVIDFIPIRYNISGSDKTSLIILCEDGIKQKQIDSGVNLIPVDFFEHYNVLNDIDFSGNDFLQLYNSHQIKHRLNTNGLYITSTKSNGFTITVTNNDSSTIITGFRVFCGSQDHLKVPSFISVGTRTLPVCMLSTPRWIDFGLHRNDIISAQNENRLNILFGNSQSPENITMIDNIKVYGTSKDNFIWPEESEEKENVNLSLAYQNDISAELNSNFSSEYDQYHLNSNNVSLFAVKFLEMFSSVIHTHQNINNIVFKKDCLEILNNFVLLPISSLVDQQIDKIMSSLIPSKDDYLYIIEKLLIEHVAKQFKKLVTLQNFQDVDPEMFYLLVKNIHQITSRKPNNLYYVCEKYNYNIVNNFYKLISQLYKVTPSCFDPFVLIQSGLLHVEFIFHVMVETIFCYCMNDPGLINDYKHMLFEMLTCYNTKIRHIVKNSLTQFFKPKRNSIEDLQRRECYWTSYNYNLLKLQIINILSDMAFNKQQTSIKNERVVPIMQVLLALMLTINLKVMEEKNVFITTLKCLLCSVLKIESKDSFLMENYDITIVTLKFLTLLMSRCKTKQNNSTEEGSSFDISQQTARCLLEENILLVCLKFLQSNFRSNFMITKADSNLLTPSNVNEVQYLHPFFTKYDLKSQNYKLFDPSIPQLTEAIVKLIYQVIKISGELLSVNHWFIQNIEDFSTLLCDLMMDADDQNVRKIIRKTLLLICGSKEGYRNLKDKRSIEKSVKSVLQILKQQPYSPDFDELVIIANDLKYCYDIAVLRPINWQTVCNSNDEILQALFICSCSHNEEVLHIVIINLISLSICKTNNLKGSLFSSCETSTSNRVLVFLMPTLLETFVKKFLIYNCAAKLKFQVHHILKTMFEDVDNTIKLFWNIYNKTSAEVKSSPHFIDLLCYFSHTAFISNSTYNSNLNQVLSTIKNQNKLLSDHPASYIYPYLHCIIEMDGYYFDPEPCLDCNNYDVQPTTLKLSAVKADARFSTSSMIIKLIQSYCISKIFLKITEIKKSKMVRSINILYSNHNIQATADLKSKIDTWRKAKSIKLLPGQTDIRVEFCLPFTACNLMIEYVDFYETVVGCSETLQCPRCSAVVSSNPGICGNCGENVFQCHKCRAINYDEKDPFLCNSCGFSKFAKFDFSLVGKPSFVMDSIEDDEERNRLTQVLRNLTEKADRIYRQLQSNKGLIELLLFKCPIQDKKINLEQLMSSNNPSSGFHKTIHIISQKYCIESKTLNDDLCILLWKIKAFRRSILLYDKKQNKEIQEERNGNQHCYRCILTSIVSNILANILKNDITHTKKICRILKKRCNSILYSCLPEYCIDVAIRGDLLLIEALGSIYDSCCDVKFKTIFEILLQSSSYKHVPALIITQSCLKLLLRYIVSDIENNKLQQSKVQSIDFKSWYCNRVCFQDWRKNEKSCVTPNNTLLQEKYFNLWKYGNHQLRKMTPVWLVNLIFNFFSSDIRQMTSTILLHLSKHEKKTVWCVNMAINLLDKAGENDQHVMEFINYFKHLILGSPWQHYLVLKGFLKTLIELISVEIDKLLLEEKHAFSVYHYSTHSLVQLLEILISFWDVQKIREKYKVKLLKPILEGYLNIRKISLQRNISIEFVQEKLLMILENVTSGSDADITHFITVCIEILNSSAVDDIKTKVFAFERLCSLIHQDENDIGEFFLNLEKDPQQEDFLQGRMLGNPYSSAESALGPQMRNIKNKICSDCELIALLEDDNGMELLVSNKIINLDLLVKDVYKMVWLKNGGDRETMKIVYRMRGLLGDATEEFVEAVEDSTDENIDYEKKHRMANVVADCGGLEVMLNCLECDIDINADRSLLEVVLKLFSLCSKVKRCQKALCRPEMRAVEVFLKALDQCIQYKNAAIVTNLIENLLEIINTILSKAASDSLDLFLRLSLTFGGPEYVQSLLNYASLRNCRVNSNQAQIHLAKVLAALVYGNDIKMKHLCDYFKTVLDFNKFDKEHSTDDELRLELFCIITVSIEPNIVGNILKDYIMNLGILQKSLNYIVAAPIVKSTLLIADCPDLKNFISRPALKYVLRILTGLCIKHEPTQKAIAKEAIPIIHMLEQVSSDEHVGTLAENLLETLCSNDDISKKVQEVRDLTKAEKKRLAMATRQKQLHSLGMKTNEKGQVTVNVNPIEELDKLKEETGLYCFICREGYMYQPTKVLGIYTYSKRVVLEEYETKPRKRMGYSTVTHFNIVHVDCHISAIRLARGRDEWESASLQNTNTKGPDVPEISFATCVNRQQNYIRDATQCNDISFESAIHDLKLLLERFAYERSFHVDSGGGGPQSNINVVPYLLFHAIYILLSSHSAPNEIKKLINFINIKEKSRELSLAYNVEGPVYYIISSLALQGYSSWKKNKVGYLKKLIIIAQTRHFYPTVEAESLSDDQKKELNFDIYKPYLMMWALVELIYSYFIDLHCTTDNDWPVTIFNYIRYHDEHLLKTSEQILREFNQNFLTCTSFNEFCDVANLFEYIQDPLIFISSVLKN